MLLWRDTIAAAVGDLTDAFIKAFQRIKGREENGPAFGLLSARAVRIRLSVDQYVQIREGGRNFHSVINERNGKRGHGYSSLFKMI